MVYLRVLGQLYFPHRAEAAWCGVAGEMTAVITYVGIDPGLKGAVAFLDQDALPVLGAFS